MPDWIRASGVAAWLLLVLGFGSPNSADAATPVAFEIPAAFGPLHPRVSSDSRLIAMAWQGAIGILPIDGGSLRILTTTEGFDGVPAWSPDGRMLAFGRNSGAGPSQLQLIDAGDGSAMPLPVAVRAEGPYFFHPDDHRILGRFSISGIPGALGWYDLQSGTILPGPVEARTPGGGNSPFCLSADGRWIVYASNRDKPGEQGGNNGPRSDLWRVPSGGGEPERLTTWPARIYSLSSDAASSAVFAVTDRGSSHNDIWRIPFTNSLPFAVKLTSGQADEDSPSSAGNGSLLVHTDNHAGSTALVLRNLDNADARQVVPREITRPGPVGQVRIELWDSRGEPVTARVSLKRDEGKFHAPPGAIYRTLGGLSHFYARHAAQFTVPVGNYELTVLHGPEYRPYHARLEVTSGAVATHTTVLERWTNPATNHWYSGENHVHANYGYGPWYITPDALLEQCEGEGLNICNAVVANSDGDAVLDREFFLGSPDPLSKPGTILFWNEEFRSTIWGHLALGALGQLVEPIFTGFADTTNPYDIPTNGDIAERTRAQRGTVSYTHPASNPEDLYDRPYSAKGLPVDAALGRVDTMDVGGFGYAASIELWYRLLNCGFRVAAAAGTDCFLNRMGSYPPGWARAYVKLPNGLDYRAWQEAQVRGVSFVTDGPMLEFQVDGREAGGQVELATPRAVLIRGKVLAQYPLDSLELVSNGAVVTRGNLSGEWQIRTQLDAARNVYRSLQAR